MSGDLCIHVANIFYLVSFVNRDMLWLRILTCAGLVFGIIFFSSCTEPMYGPAAWHVVFLFINFYQIYRLILDRRETDLTPMKAVVGNLALEDLDRDQLTTLLARDINGNIDKRKSPKRNCNQELDETEKIVKQMVLERLSRAELVNLLTRRMWGPIKRRFRSKRKRDATKKQAMQSAAEKMEVTNFGGG